MKKTLQLADELNVVHGVAQKALELERWNMDRARSCCRDVVMEDCSTEVQEKLQLSELEAAYMLRENKYHVPLTIQEAMEAKQPQDRGYDQLIRH